MSHDTEELDCQMVVDFLTDGYITIKTGSTSASAYPKKIRTPPKSSYRAVRGVKEQFDVARQYEKQFDTINDIAKSLTGYELNHSWVSPDGRNFIILAGPLNDPKLIWRRTGAGPGSFNSVFYNQHKHTVDSFVNNYSESEEIKRGYLLEVTPEWRINTEQLIQEEIEYLNKPFSKSMAWSFREVLEADNARRKEQCRQARKILNESSMFQVVNRMIRRDNVVFTVQLGDEYYAVNKSDVVQYHKG